MTKRRRMLPHQTKTFDPDAGKSQQDVIDEMTGQLNLFGNENDASSADADTTPDAGDGEEKDE